MKNIIKKTLLISLALFMICFLVSCGGSGTRNDDPTANLNDYEYIIQIGDWERENAPGEIWRFGHQWVLGKSYSSGSGWTYYSWDCDEEEKTIETEYEVYTEKWSYSISKEDTRLELTNKETGEKKTFLKRGTQTIPTIPDNRPEELIGFWINEDLEEYPLIILSDENAESGFGTLNGSGSSGYISKYVKDWGASDGKIFILGSTLSLLEYTYQIDGNTLSLYDQDNTVTVYTRTNISVDGVIIN